MKECSYEFNAVFKHAPGRDHDMSYYFNRKLFSGQLSNLITVLKV